MVYNLTRLIYGPVQKCKAENVSAAEEKAAAEKRRQYADELRATRAQNAENAEEHQTRDGLDELMGKLRAGDSVGGRKGRRTRNGPGRQSISSAPRIVPQLTGSSAGDAADRARDMLAALGLDGSQPAGSSTTLSVPSSTPQVAKPRRSRLRGSLVGDTDGSRSSIDATSPRTQAPIPEGNEDEDPTVKAPTPRLDSPASSVGNFPSPGIATSESETPSDAKDLPRLPP